MGNQRTSKRPYPSEASLKAFYTIQDALEYRINKRTQYMLNSINLKFHDGKVSAIISLTGEDGYYVAFLEAKDIMTLITRLDTDAMSENLKVHWDKFRNESLDNSEEV